LDDGRLTDGLGNTIDLKNIIVIMTSNIGARHLVGQKSGLGFQNNAHGQISDKVERLVNHEVKQTFSPEFLNRLDETIIFNPLTAADLIQILELLVQQLNANLAQREITITLTEEAKAWVLEKTAAERSYGARPLRRALQRYVEDPLSDALIQGTINTRPAFIEVYLEGDGLFYRQVGQNVERMEGALLCSS
jgi:ATP-dependent Clp protease ATP-binding subunit ClpC